MCPGPSARGTSYLSLLPGSTAPQGSVAVAPGENSQDLAEVRAWVGACMPTCVHVCVHVSVCLCPARRNQKGGKDKGQVTFILLPKVSSVTQQGYGFASLSVLKGGDHALSSCSFLYQFLIQDLTPRSSQDRFGE